MPSGEVDGLFLDILAPLVLMFHALAEVVTAVGLIESFTVQDVRASAFVVDD